MKTFLKKLHALRAEYITCGCGNRMSIYSLICLQVLLVSELNAQSPDDANLIIQNSQAFFTVQIPDTINITHLEVNLGTYDGATDLFSHTFVYDQTAGLSSGMSYLREGKTVTLGLGAISTADTRFARVRLKHSGLWSDWFSFLAN